MEWGVKDKKQLIAKVDKEKAIRFKAFLAELDLKQVEVFDFLIDKFLESDWLQEELLKEKAKRVY